MTTERSIIDDELTRTPTERQQSISETVAIDATGDVLAVEVYGDTDVTFQLDADNAIDLQLNGGTDPSTYEQTGIETYTGSSDISDSFTFVSRWVIFEVTSAASSNDQATITVEATR